MPAYSAGTRVRFAADSLGTVRADGSTLPGQFASEVVNIGDAGEVVALEHAVEGWLYVKPDRYPELVVPVVDGFIELETSDDQFVEEPGLEPGERRDRESGLVVYSSRWL